MGVSGESDEETGGKKKRKKAAARDPRENDPSRPSYQHSSRESPAVEDEAERLPPTSEQMRAAASCPMGLGEVLSCAEDDEFDAEAEAEEGFVIYNGIKVPKGHLPDEKLLGSRLTVIRLKRAVERSASSVTPGTGASGDETRNGAALKQIADAGLDASALFSEESDEELGKDLLVSYLIDGRNAYTIPFTAARRYCSQQLLSFLLRRLTFRTTGKSPSWLSSLPQTSGGAASGTAKFT